MQWLEAIAISPALPDHCTPTNDFLLRFSSTFYVCLPTPLAFVSQLLGVLSICSWLFAQLPQIYKNYSLRSTSGLSIFFLVEWCLGDAGNLLGALFTHQAHWQVVIGGYYVFVDLCLVMQWVWYEKLQHGRHMFRVKPSDGGHSHGGNGDGMEQVVIEGMDPAANGRGPDGSAPRSARPRPIFRQPTFGKTTPQDEKNSPSLSATPRGTTIHRVGPSSPMPSPSPRTVLMIACLVAMTQASPLASPAPESSAHPSVITQRPTPLENAGTILSWLSTVLYLGSRLPQLYKNYRRKSTAGLSPHLFAAAFCGNFFYSAAILTNPSAWSDMGPFGGGGWAGPEGSQRIPWITAALPFFLGAAGVLGLDASVGIQFYLYGEGEAKVVVIEDGRGTKWRWRRVSGWMRGWVPSISDGWSSRPEERQVLLENGDREGGVGYDAI